MGKKKNKKGFDFSTSEGGASDNPFAALKGLGKDLPPPPANLPKKKSSGADAGAVGSSLKAKMPLRLHLDRKHRRGKEATIVTGFKGTNAQMQALAKLLKTRCGVGGSAKDWEIIIQGNKRDKILEILLEEGYQSVKKSGG